MKKLFFGALALALVAGFSACNKDCSTSSKGQANDTLSVAYGKYVGGMVGNDFAHFDSETADGKDKFLQGMKLVFNAPEDRNVRLGMRVALSMLGEMDQMNEQGIVLNRQAAMKAFKQVFTDDSLDMAMAQDYGQKFGAAYREAVAQLEQQKKEQTQANPEAVDNEKQAADFVKALKESNPNVQTTPSGLMYVIEEPGTMPTPDSSATVVVNYTGKHLNGEVFDSTDGRGPATFALEGVVPGFREGLMLLGKGGKATLYIPADLAYGANGAPGTIGPNEMLVFDVELLDINPQ